MAIGKGVKRAPATQEANRKNRREFIVGEAAKLFARAGYQAATMDELSAMTGLNKGTIYYYYKSKSDILYDMVISIANRSLTLAAPAVKMEHAADSLAHVIEIMVRWIGEHRDAVRTYFQESPYFDKIFSEEQNKAVRDQQKLLMKIIYSTLEKGHKSGELIDFDVTVTGRLITGMLMWIYRWPEDELEVDRIIHSISTIILYGIAQVKVGDHAGK